MWQIPLLGFRLGLSLIILIHNVHMQAKIENRVTICENPSGVRPHLGFRLGSSLIILNAYMPKPDPARKKKTELFPPRFHPTTRMKGIPLG